MATNPFAKKDTKAIPYGGKETLEEEEAEHGVKLDEPLESHEGLETPEEEAAEEAEIAEKYPDQAAGMTPRLFVDEVRALLDKLDAPVKPMKTWSINETKTPL